MGRLTSMTNNLEGNSRQSNNFQYSRVCRLEWTFDNNPSSAKQGVKVPAENFLVCVRRINHKSHHINTAHYIGTAGPSRRHLLFLIRKATVSDARDPDPLSRLISRLRWLGTPWKTRSSALILPSNNRVVSCDIRDHSLLHESRPITLNFDIKQKLTPPALAGSSTVNDNQAAQLYFSIKVCTKMICPKPICCVIVLGLMQSVCNAHSLLSFPRPNTPFVCLSQNSLVSELNSLSPTTTI